MGYRAPEAAHRYVPLTGMEKLTSTTNSPSFIARAFNKHFGGMELAFFACLR